MDSLICFFNKKNLRKNFISKRSNKIIQDYFKLFHNFSINSKLKILHVNLNKKFNNNHFRSNIKKEENKCHFKRGREYSIKLTEKSL